MALGRSFSVALTGVQGALVECEADLADGLPALRLIGLPDASLNESRERVRAAVTNSGYSWPQRKITVALLPATMPKSGSAFDLALALSVLCADDRVRADVLAEHVVLGELGLDGRVREIRGVLPMVLAAAAAGRTKVIVPRGNTAEAGLVPDVEVIGVRSLREVMDYLCHDVIPPQPAPEAVAEGDGRTLDLSQVGGQLQARRALEVAAAGGHHLFMEGAPGAGKTMLAERMPTILPPLSDEWALEVSAIHSVAGLLQEGAPLVRTPPFRAPHHSATIASLVGGGSSYLRPGELSCAHRGILFLDEVAEFGPKILDAMRQPLESGAVWISRARGTVRFPCRFSLIMASNPCPCAKSTLECSCTPMTKIRYRGRISGPLLDRVDMQVKIAPVSRADLVADQSSTETSETVAGRVLSARGAAAQRLRGTPWRLVGEVPTHVMRERWPLSTQVLAPALRQLERGQLSARGLDRVIRLAWTLADLAGVGSPGAVELGEALSLRLEKGPV